MRRRSQGCLPNEPLPLLAAQPSCLIEAAQSSGCPTISRIVGQRSHDRSLTESLSSSPRGSSGAKAGLGRLWPCLGHNGAGWAFRLAVRAIWRQAIVPMANWRRLQPLGPPLLEVFVGSSHSVRQLLGAALRPSGAQAEASHPSRRATGIGRQPATPSFTAWQF